MPEELAKEEVAQVEGAAKTETTEAKTETSYVDLIKGLGFENVADEKEAVSRLIEAYKQKDEATKALSQQVAQAIEEVRRVGTPQTQEPQQTQGDERWWSPPEIDTALASKYRNADGSWKAETPTSLKQMVEQAEAYYDKWANDLVRQPDKVLPKIIRQEAEKIVREVLSQTTMAQRQAQIQEQIFSDNPWLFEKDPITGHVNRGKLSAEGQLLNEHFIAAQEKGFSFEDAWDWAYSKHQLAKLMALQKMPDGKEAEEANAKKKQELLGRASGATLPRGGSLPPATAPTRTQNRNLTFGERFARQVKENGVSLG
jgi:hypothetical protein